MPHIQNALGSLTATLAGLYLVVAILRFLFQLLRVDFRNPLVRTIVAITNPPLRLLRRVIPGLYGIDLAAVVLIWSIGLLKLALVLVIAGHPFRWSGALIVSLADSLDTLVWVFLIAVLARVVVSWVAPRSHHPAIRIVEGLSEPVMAPFRRLLPPLGGLDLSPILTLLALRLAQQIVVAPLLDFGVRLL